MQTILSTLAFIPVVLVVLLMIVYGSLVGCTLWLADKLSTVIKRVN